MTNPVALFAGLSSKHKDKILKTIYQPKKGKPNNGIR